MLARLMQPRVSWSGCPVLLGESDVRWECCFEVFASWRANARACAALPFICLNVLAGGLTMYGLANLRYEGWAIGAFCGLLLLQSLVAIQVVMFAVYLTPNQARAALISVRTWAAMDLWYIPCCAVTTCVARPLQSVSRIGVAL